MYLVTYTIILHLCCYNIYKHEEIKIKNVFNVIKINSYFLISKLGILSGTEIGNNLYNINMHYS